MLENILYNYYDEEFTIVDGMDEAVIGLDVYDMRLIYSVRKCLEILRRDMSESDAREHFDYNYLGADMGDRTPIWCMDVLDPEN